MSDVQREAVTAIKKKLIILKNRMPFSADTKKYFADIEKREWVYRNMKIDGSSLTEAQIDTVSEGEVRLNVPIGEYLKVERVTALLKKMWDLAEMKRSLDLNLIDELHRVICPNDGKKLYRRKNTVIQEYEYTPPLPGEIPEKLELLGAELIQAEDVKDVGAEMFMYAALIHNKIIEIYPYGEEDKLLARAAAAYYLMLKGFPAVTPDMKEQDYNDMTAGFIRKGGLTDTAGAWEKAVLGRLSLMIQLTRY